MHLHLGTRATLTFQQSLGDMKGTHKVLGKV